VHAVNLSLSQFENSTIVRSSASDAAAPKLVLTPGLRTTAVSSLAEQSTRQTTFLFTRLPRQTSLAEQAVRQTSVSKRAFLTRALLLRLPGFGRAQRAADLFCTPMPGTRARALSADLAGFAPYGVQIGGVTYQAYVFGDPTTQPYIVCAHGWSSFGLRFTPWAKAAAAAGYALVCFDHGAHGRSDGRLGTFASFVAGVNAMRSAFGEPAAGVGHSFGAAALAMAASESGLRCPLVLVAPPADLMVAIRFFSERIKLTGHIAQIAAELSLRVQRDVRTYAAKFSMARVRQPMLVIHDVADSEVSWSAGAQYAMLAPNARLLSTQGLGHHRILNDPATISAAFAHFSGVVTGEKLLVSNVDLQAALA
jgi:pimeloyl-ACP methyl ester carboxylesterase